MSKINTANLLSQLLHSRTQAHIYHFRTTSFAAHSSFNEYYEAIVPLLDSYAEAYQGKYGLIRGYSIGTDLDQNPKNAKKYFTRLLQIVQSTKVKATDNFLQNILDEIATLINKTLYSLSLK